MLVIDRVVLPALDEAKQMRELQRHHARVLDQRAQPGGETPDVGNVGEDVVARHQVGPAVLRRDLPGPSRSPGTRPPSGCPGTGPPLPRSPPARRRAPVCPRPRSAAGGSRRCSPPRSPGCPARDRAGRSWPVRIAWRGPPRSLSTRRSRRSPRRCPHPARRPEAARAGTTDTGARAAGRRPPRRRGGRLGRSSRRAATSPGRRRCSSDWRHTTGKDMSTSRSPLRSLQAHDPLQAHD